MYIESDNAAHNKNIEKGVPEITGSKDGSRSDTTSCMDNGEQTQYQILLENQDSEVPLTKVLFRKGNIVTEGVV